MNFKNNKWRYKGKIIECLADMPGEPFGFVYKITHIPTGKMYIGKKQLQFNVKKKITKKELLEYTGRGKKPIFKRVVKESDWETYYGSNADIKKLIKEGKEDEFQREILYFCKDKKHLTYIETKLLFNNEVLENPDKYWNDNILGKFFTKDF